MTDTSAPNDPITDVVSIFDRLQKIVGPVASVVVKYPPDTLPEQLKPFRGAPRVGLARPSTKGDGELVLKTTSTWQPGQIRIPASWLSMQQSEITRAVRDIYWADKDHGDMRELHRLGSSLEDHVRAAKRHTEAAERDRRDYELLAARISERRKR